MQIDGVKAGSSTATNKVKKKANSSKFSLGNEDNVDDISSVEEEAQNITPVNNYGGGLAMFARMEERSRRHKKVIKQGRRLLDQLEDIKKQIILGNIDNDCIMQLRAIIEQEKVVIEDPQLKELFEFIQQRAKVELAKLGMI